jgi:hypothetical protein
MVYAKYPGGQYLTQYLVRGLPYEKFGQILTQTRVLLSAYPPSVVLVLMFIQIGKHILVILSAKVKGESGH